MVQTRQRQLAMTGDVDGAGADGCSGGLVGMGWGFYLLFILCN